MSMGICLVDDTASQRLVLSALLKGAGYSNIYAVASATAAFELLGMTASAAEQPPIDLVLMDISMPDLDGIEACRRIKANPATRDIPVIMVTASNEVADLQLAFAAGAMDYITKPVVKMDLAVRVRSALNLKREIDERKAHEQELLELTEYLEAANRVLIEQSQKSNQLLRAIYDIGDHLHANAELHDSLQTMIASINSIIAYDSAEICIYDAEKDVLLLAVVANPLYTQNMIQQRIEYPVHASYRSLLLAGHKGLLIRDTEQFTSIARSPNHVWHDVVPRSYIGVPLLGKNGVIGTIELISQTINGFADDNLRFLQSIAIQAAGVLSHAQESVRRELSLQERMTSLNIEIDAEKRSRQVDAIIGSDFFQAISRKAQESRQRRSSEQVGSA